MGAYRTYGVEQVAFDDVPGYREGGPSKTVVDDYSVSYETLCRGLSSAEVVAADDGMVTLSARRQVSHSPYASEPHALDQTKYPTHRDAERAAYDAGLLHFWVPERDVEAFEAKYLRVHA